jgi:hypothetical protein
MYIISAYEGDLVFCGTSLVPGGRPDVYSDYEWRKQHQVFFHQQGR